MITQQLQQLGSCNLILLNMFIKRLQPQADRVLPSWASSWLKQTGSSNECDLSRSLPGRTLI
jgi:hypothetical protein